MGLRNQSLVVERTPHFRRLPDAAADNSAMSAQTESQTHPASIARCTSSNFTADGDASIWGCAEYLGLCRILTKVADALFSSSWRMLVVQFCPLESDVCAQARRPVHFAT